MRIKHELDQLKLPISLKYEDCKICEFEVVSPSAPFFVSFFCHRSKKWPNKMGILNCLQFHRELSVWPDWTIFKVFGHNFSSLSSQNVQRWQLGLSEKYFLHVKTGTSTFWLPLRTFWATFYFYIWSHWQLCNLMITANCLITTTSVLSELGNNSGHSNVIVCNKC